VRETEAIIGKAPRLGIQTPKFKRDIQHVMPSVNVITFSKSKYIADPELKNSFILQPRSALVSVKLVSGQTHNYFFVHKVLVFITVTSLVLILFIFNAPN